MQRAGMDRVLTHFQQGDDTLWYGKAGITTTVVNDRRERCGVVAMTMKRRWP